MGLPRRRGWARSIAPGIALGIAVGVLACSSESGPPPKYRAELYENCDDPIFLTECQDGLVCVPYEAGFGSSFCSRACATDGECGSGLCSPDATGATVCAERCNYVDPTYLGNFICQEGRAVACSPTACAAGLTCVHGRGCLKPYGEACSAHGECLSNNCGMAGTCKVADGQGCTRDTCDACLTYAASPGWTFCGKSCTRQSDCLNSYCLGQALIGSTPDSYSCTPKCSDQCPEVCRVTTIGGVQVEYCDATLVLVPL